jgi:hypothetical protein
MTMPLPPGIGRGKWAVRSAIGGELKDHTYVTAPDQKGGEENVLEFAWADFDDGREGAEWFAKYIAAAVNFYNDPE